MESLDFSTSKLTEIKPKQVQKNTIDTSFALQQYFLVKYCFEAIFIAKVLTQG